MVKAKVMRLSGRGKYKMKRLLLAPVFKLFNKRTFLSSLNQNSCPVLDAEEIKKQEQKEAIEKLYP